MPHSGLLVKNKTFMSCIKCPEIKEKWWLCARKTGTKHNMSVEDGHWDWSRRKPGTHITKGLWDQDWPFVKVLFVYTFYSCEDIRSQICTCHDSSAVVACAKLRPDMIIVVAVKANIFELWARGLFVKSVTATYSADIIYLAFEHQLLFTSHSFLCT